VIAFDKSGFGEYMFFHKSKREFLAFDKTMTSSGCLSKEKNPDKTVLIRVFCKN